MFVVTLFIIGEKCKQPKCPSIDECINKMWYIHTVEYSAIKRNKELIHVTTWMNLENVC